MSSGNCVEKAIAVTAHSPGVRGWRCCTRAFRSKPIQWRRPTRTRSVSAGSEKVPIIRDDGGVISDSWKIACYLEAEYPDRPTLFGGQPGQNLTYFMNLWADRELVPSLVPPLMLDVLGCVEERDAVHLRTQMETIFKKSLEDLYAERAKSLDQFRKRLAPMRRILSASPFLAGDGPAYADYITFGILQWARVVSTEKVLEDDDIVSSWFERVLDLYGGAGRQERSRHDRSGEQPS